MNVKELLVYFENYYGEKYTGVFLEVMLDYFENCSVEFLQAVAKVIILRYPRSFNKSPDVAIIEKNFEEISKWMIKIQIQNALPEPPEERCDPEIARKYISEMREIFKNPCCGGLANGFEKIVDAM